jgi:hypothetical protein
MIKAATYHFNRTPAHVYTSKTKMEQNVRLSKLCSSTMLTKAKGQEERRAMHYDKTLSMRNGIMNKQQSTH